MTDLRRNNRAYNVLDKHLVQTSTLRTFLYLRA